MYESQELCSDIIFELVKAANMAGEIENPYPFIWKVARNVYADHSSAKSKHAQRFYQGDAEKILPFIADKTQKDDSSALLTAVYRRIAFLTRSYREVMILFYIEGRSIAEIAQMQKASEVAIRQRLFAARQKIKGEIEEMTEANHKPVALDNIRYVIWGNGTPAWGDPRKVCTRTFSDHIENQKAL